LLRRGFHIAFITPDPGKQWDAWYAFLTEKHGLSKKPSFDGMSKGGVNAYQWATANPDKVSAIYADNPAIRQEDISKLVELARRDVPLLNVCGSLDFVLEKNTKVIENVYHQAGGRITIMIKEGTAHHPHSLQDPKPIADFVEQSQAAPAPRPAFLDDTFVKSSYYSVENSYIYLQKEDTYATCRGPQFSQSYDRYDKTNRSWGTTGMAVLVPKNPAAVKRWVLRADRIDRTTSEVDLALLAKGYYVVTPPLLAGRGPQREDWNAVYQLMTDAGFSKKPALEGAGAGAGEAYAWAVENADKVSRLALARLAWSDHDRGFHLKDIAVLEARKSMYGSILTEGRIRNRQQTEMLSEGQTWVLRENYGPVFEDQNRAIAACGAVKYG